MTIYNYAKLSTEEKAEIIKYEAIFIEDYLDNGTIIYVHYFNGFFIEVTKLNGKVIDNVPFIRGYKIDKKKLHDIEKRNAIFEIAA